MAQHSSAPADNYYRICT